MEQKSNQKIELNKKEEALSLKPSTKNIFVVNETQPEYNVNLIFFENNNIDSKAYFKQQKIEEQQKKAKDLKKLQKNQNSLSLPLNEPKPQLEKDTNNIFSLSDFSDFSDTEDEDIKKEREEIIQKMNKKNDILEFVEFDIFDYSNMNESLYSNHIDSNEDNEYIPPVKKFAKKDKQKKEEQVSVNNEAQSTHASDGSNSKIELIKKADNKSKINKDRMNNFKKINHRQVNIIGNKSKSSKRGIGRSRSREKDY
jgi:hypothetical protein